MPVRNKKAVAKERDKEAVPLTNELQLKSARKAINARNKTRSKAMERRIAAYLKGRRIPMSGAAAKYKGDVEIPLVNNPGMYLIECKLSDATDGTTGKPAMRLQFPWFPKIHAEAKAMNAKFGVLIIHYHNQPEDYVFISSDVLQLLTTRYQCNFSAELLQLWQQEPFDIRTNKVGKACFTYMLTLPVIIRSMKVVNGIQGFKLRLPDRDYLLVRLSDFRQIVEPL